MGSSRHFSDTIRFLSSAVLYAAIAGIVSAVAAYMMSGRLPDRFDAMATLYSAPLPQSEAWLAGIRFAPTRLDGDAYALAAVSNSVLLRAMQAMEEAGYSGSLDELREATNVRVEDTVSSSFVYLTARMDSPEMAARAANAIASGLLEWDSERIAQAVQVYKQAMETQLAALVERAELLGQESDDISRRQFDANLSSQSDLRTTMAMLDSFSSLGFSTLRVLDSATAPLAPSAPRPVLTAVLAFVVAMIGTFGLLAVIQAMNEDRRSRDIAQRL